MKHWMYIVLFGLLGLFFSEVLLAQGPPPRIRMQIGGASFITTGNQLSVTIEVDASTPMVVVGTPADQMFRDDFAEAAYFGYYLTLGIRTQNQNNALSVNFKANAGPGATPGRTFGIIGNGVTTPSQESDLTQLGAGLVTFANAPVNVTRCGPSYAANGIGGGGINCNAGNTINQLDVTQFIKVSFSDSSAGPVTSQASFIAVVE